MKKRPKTSNRDSDCNSAENARRKEDAGSGRGSSDGVNSWFGAFWREILAPLPPVWRKIFLSGIAILVVIFSVVGLLLRNPGSNPFKIIPQLESQQSQPGWDVLIANSSVKPDGYYLPIGETGLFFWPLSHDNGKRRLAFSITASSKGPFVSIVTNSTLDVGGKFLFKDTDNITRRTNLFRIWLWKIQKPSLFHSTAAFITAEREANSH